MNTENDLQNNLDPQLEGMLKTLRRSETRDPRAAETARSNFLAAAEKYLPVSISNPERLNILKEPIRIFRMFKRKENKIVFNFVMSIVILFSVVFGGGAATVAAAQSALPEGFLYPVKTWTEELRLGWENDPQGQVDLAIQFTARRAEEIKNMLMQQGDIPEPVVARYANQHQLALKLAANLPDDQVPAALLKLQEQIRAQEQIMRQLHLTGEAGELLRTRLQTMLRTQAQAAEQGCEDPAWLREYLRNQQQNQFQAGSPPDLEDPDENGAGPENGNMQQNQSGQSEEEEDKGPGPGEPQNQQQGNPEETGNEPGECQGEECLQQNQNQNGEPQPNPEPDPDPQPNPQQGPSDNNANGDKSNGK